MSLSTTTHNMKLRSRHNSLEQVTAKYQPSDKQKPNVTVDQAIKQLAARFYQTLPHGTIPAVDHEKVRRQVLVV